MEQSNREKIKIYTEKEIAAELMVSPWTIRLWRLQVGLPHFRTAGRIFYRLETVLHWMEVEERRNVDLLKEEAGQNKVKRIAQ